MGKALKLTLTLMLIIFGLFFIIPVFLPSQIEVSATKEIKQPKSVVFEQIENLQNRLSWSPFTKNKDMRDSLSANPSGIGAKYFWVKGDTITRILTVTKVNKPDYAEVELWFPDHHGATEKWSLTGDSTYTKVNWNFTVLNLRYPFGKWLGLIMSNSLQPVLKAGLDKLEKVSEHKNTGTKASQ